MKWNHLHISGNPEQAIKRAAKLVKQQQILLSTANQQLLLQDF
jgi:hypothetical protein